LCIQLWRGPIVRMRCFFVGTNCPRTITNYWSIWTPLRCLMPYIYIRFTILRNSSLEIGISDTVFPLPHTNCPLLRSLGNIGQTYALFFLNFKNIWSNRLGRLCKATSKTLHKCHVHVPCMCISDKGFQGLYMYRIRILHKIVENCMYTFMRYNINIYAQYHLQLFFTIFKSHRSCD